MSDTISTRHGVPVLMCAPDGPTVGVEQDALDLIGATYGQGADVVVAIPVERLDERFFTLSTKLAGEFIQKFVQYGRRVAIVGDIAEHIETSSALRDFVAESNRGNHVWFVPDLATLDGRLRS